MRILYFLCFLTLGTFACQQTPNTAKKEIGGKDKVISSKPSSKPKVTSAKKPTPPSNYIISTARPKQEINATFPYNIELKKANGDTILSSEAFANNGQPTVLLFWLTTCYPCRMEMDAIKKKYKGWQEETDFNLVAISTDYSKNYPKFVERVKQQNWPWEAFVDHNREFKSILPGGLNGLPQTFVIDGKGNIAYHKRKYSTGDEDKLYEVVKKLAKPTI